MIKLNRFAKLTVMAAAGGLLLGNLAACSHGPNPNAKKVLMACLAVTNIEAGKILGGELTAFKLSGEGSPVHICEYNNANNDTLGLLQIKESDSKDPADDLAKDAAMQKGLFKNNIVPVVIHPADGFGDGAFYLDVTQSPTAKSVQLHIIENGYKMMAQVNNPKDFATGEKQATALAQQAFANIKSGAAFQTL
ncbi:MAG: hypothetical protein ACRESX_04975 [Gammaproteobacteria bacterium]